MSARIPHLLTRLLSASECDDLLREYVNRSREAIGTPAERIWMDAAILLSEHREASLQARTNHTPSARRKSLSYSPVAAVCDRR